MSAKQIDRTKRTFIRVRMTDETIQLLSQHASRDGVALSPGMLINHVRRNKLEFTFRPIGDFAERHGWCDSTVRLNADGIMWADNPPADKPMINELVIELMSTPLVTTFSICVEENRSEPGVPYFKAR